MKLKLFIILLLSILFSLIYSSQVLAQSVGSSCDSANEDDFFNGFCGRSGCSRYQTLICKKQGRYKVWTCVDYYGCRVQCRAGLSCTRIITPLSNAAEICSTDDELDHCCRSCQTLTQISAGQYYCTGSCASNPPTPNSGQSGCGLCPTSALPQCGPSVQPNQCYWNATSQTCSFSSSCGGGGYQPACAWTDNRPNCLGDGSSASNCRTQLGSSNPKCQCCPGLSEGSNGACGCPTPPPPPPTCRQIQKDVANPVIGSKVRFTCSASSDAQTYEFRYWKTDQKGQGGHILSPFWDTSITAANKGRVSNQLTITRSGVHQVQCRACRKVNNVTTCSAWQ